MHCVGPLLQWLGVVRGYSCPVTEPRRKSFSLFLISLMLGLGFLFFFFFFLEKYHILSLLLPSSPLYVFLAFLEFLFLEIQVLVWYYIPFLWKISLKFLRCISNNWLILSAFMCLQMYFTSCFLCGALKILLCCLLVCIIRDDFFLCVSVCSISVLICCLYDFLLIFGFQLFDYDVSRWFFKKYIHCLEFSTIQALYDYMHM